MSTKWSWGHRIKLFPFKGVNTLVVSIRTKVTLGQRWINKCKRRNRKGPFRVQRACARQVGNIRTSLTVWRGRWRKHGDNGSFHWRK